MGGTPRSRRINSQAGDEMINAATDCIGGNALHHGPGIAIGGSAYHDIVRATTAFKATVLPGNIDFARAVYLGRRQWLSTNAGHLVISFRGD